MHLLFHYIADREFADGGGQPPRCGTRAAAAKPAGVKHICKVSRYLHGSKCTANIMICWRDGIGQNLRN